MCGIAGLLETTSAGRGVDAADLRRMAKAIVHRGPDDDGYFTHERVGLAMRRLSIIDVAGGHQPMTNEDGTIVVVFNGEIYNYRPLREQLINRGHRLFTESDTEVIPHLYEEYGDELVEHLRGMFSFALWDGRRNRLLVARDRIGIKPLYYTEEAGRLAFASEIKAILAVRQTAPDVDPQALGQYLALKYVPSPATLFAGIRSLPPGCMLVVDEGRPPQVKRYWDLTFSQPDEPRSLDEYAAELERLLRDSVAVHLQSDVPFGAFLSGGIDSSLVVALMSEVLTRPVKTFAIGFATPEGPKGELPYARQVASAFATDHHELIMTGRHFVDAAERVVWHLDQPLGDDATIPMLLLSDLAARKVKMVLSGEGGDELFAGYARYVGEQAAPSLDLLPARLRARALTLAKRATRSRRPQIALQALARSDSVSRLAHWFPLFDEEMRRELLAPAWSSLADGALATAPFADALSGGPDGDALSRMLYCDTKLWLPDLLLARGDKMGMAASIELRVPLLDHPLVEFAAQLPSALKVRRLQRKVLLRAVARRHLPIDVIERKKEGFPVPIGQWFRGEARPLVEDTLATTAVSRRGFFDVDYVTRLLREHQEGTVDHGSLLWSLVSLELWLRRFVDGSPGSTSDVQQGGFVSHL